MDTFSGYNQIFINHSYQDNTTFITEHGIYCYKEMPFGLKNASATYQSLVNRVFGSEIGGKSEEFYVNDMMVKSDTREQYLKDLH